MRAAMGVYGDGGGALSLRLKKEGNPRGEGWKRGLGWILFGES